MPQAVQSDVRVAKKSPPPCEFVVGQKVRLLPHLEYELYMVVLRHGEHKQVLYDELHYLVDTLKAGATIKFIEKLNNPVDDQASAAADDCWFALGFGNIRLKLAAWQFEAVEE